MNLAEVLEELEIPLAPEGHHHQTPGWIQTDCPWCSPNSGHWRLGINSHYLYCSCWSCGGHKLDTTLALLSGRSVHEIKGLLAGLVPEGIGKVPHKGKLIIPKGVGPLLPVHEKYLRRRGFDSQKISKLWGVGGIGMHSWLAWRLFIPIHLHGEIVSWTTRTVGSKGLRYINANPREEAVPAKDLLFGQDLARHAIVVVEGPFDAFRIGPGAVATMGLSYSREQLFKMSQYPVRVICFDQEDKAQQRARGLANDLLPFPGKTSVVVPQSADPGDMSEEEVREIRRTFLE